jgi:hypothetical protein
VNFGMQGFWDSPPQQWPSINTAFGVFSFSALDSALVQAYTGGVMQSLAIHAYVALVSSNGSAGKATRSANSSWRFPGLVA